MSAIGVFGSALLAVLVHPRWWLLALAAFLSRGGLLLLLLPVIPLPTTAALANALGPTLVGFVFGGPSVAFLLLIGALVLAIAAWLLSSGLIGAALDLRLVREVVADDEFGPAEPPTHGDPWRALAVRWAGHLPTLVVTVWGAVPLVDAAYAELVHPGDASLPVVVRVLLRVPDVVVALVGAWILGEAVGGLAVRHLVWGTGIRRSLLRGLRSIIHPSALVVLALTSLILVAALWVGGMAVSQAFEQARFELMDGGTPLAQWLALVLLSASWFGTILLVALAVALRSTAWTYEAARQRRGRTHEIVG